MMNGMLEVNGRALNGGLMNAPKLFNNKVYRKTTKSTQTIHQLLKHVRKKGINWVPEPISFDSDTEVLSFIKGEVPHDMPEWIWSRNILIQIATHIRDWHDATTDFKFDNAHWSFNTDTEYQVICHNDFAPYNCEFEKKVFTGLIDFDLCAPGSRLWDLSYTAYRFIPVIPYTAIEEGEEKSPFDIVELNNRIEIFLQAYSKKQPHYEYTREELLLMITKRLSAISEWIKNFSEETKNDVLMKNALMYKRHSSWILGIISK
ncbi:MAG TPA: phosphotransferase [Chitinispirillaceae bacterium]|nr:phosphotransferase [Chitinispirillaceae bacterium]